MQQPAPVGDRSRVDMQQGALSLKARETASLSLKRIFEQHLQMNTCSTTTTTTTLDRHLQNDNECRDQHASLDVDLDLRLAAPNSTSTPCTSINLSGNAEAAGNKSFISTSKVAQLTIFYAGTVCVFDDVPADKAKAIMLLAAGSAGDHQSCGNAARKSRSTPVKPLTRSQAELPFARKASLARFLEKRKDRSAAEGEIKSTSCGEISEPPQKRLCIKH